MKNKAFTLIELLVVIIIIGILSAISVSTFQGYFERARIAKAQMFAGQYKKLLQTEFNTIFYYDFEKEVAGKIKDMGGLGFDLPIQNGTRIIDNDAPEGINYAFNNNDGNGRTFTPKIEYPFSKWAASMWIKPLTDSLHTNVLFVNWGDHSSGTTHNFNIQFYSGYTLSVPNMRLQRTDGAFAEVTNINEKLQLNKWQHLAFSYDGDTKKAQIFLDGEKIKEVINPFFPSNNLSLKSIIVLLSNDSMLIDDFMFGIASPGVNF